jgi:amino acid transporter
MTSVAGNAGRFLAVWSTFTTAVFAYLGTELVGVNVGEAADPRKGMFIISFDHAHLKRAQLLRNISSALVYAFESNLTYSSVIPRAIKLTFYRILLFYVVLIFFLGMLVPYNSKDLATGNKAGTNAAASPFVVAMKISGIKALPAILNVCILIFVFSAANSDLYIASRTLYGLAHEGKAPRIFTRIDERGVPIYALAISVAFCLLAFMSVNTSSATVFGYLTNLVTIFKLLT